MKRNLLIVALVLCSMTVMGQENMFTLSGGYVFTNIEDVDENATGFRINGLYEYNPSGGMVAHGLSFGWLQTKASSAGADYTVSSFPLYYAPKVIVGQGALRDSLSSHWGLITQTSREPDHWEILTHGTSASMAVHLWEQWHQSATMFSLTRNMSGLTCPTAPSAMDLSTQLWVA